MNTLKNIGLITSAEANPAFELSAVSRMQGYKIKKVLVADNITGTNKYGYTNAELVKTKEAIINDENIGLIVLTGLMPEHIELVSEVLKSGKPVKIQ